MRKNILILLFFIINTIRVAAQVPASYTGNWKGKLNVGVELIVIFHISGSGNKDLIITADSPDQSVYGIPCDDSFISGDSIFIKMKPLNAAFAGKLENDTTIKGLFTQRIALPLTLTKTEDGSVQRNRPQTPQPPFPYKSENVEYYNKDQSIHFGATITIPDGKGPFPAVMLVSGSGPQNRDADILGHKFFAVLADYLTRNGLVVLRADERGIGQSTGVFSTATSVDFASDISAGVDYLLIRPEVNKKKTGLIGHSEGGMVAPMVAVSRKDIGFLILLAGPGIKNIDLMTEQNAAIIESTGISKAVSTAYTTLYKDILNDILNAPDSAAAFAAARQSLTDWLKETDEKFVKELGLASSQKQEELVRSLTETMLTPWYRYFLSYDPAPTLEQIKCPVLALNGSKDIQVLPASNLDGIRQALKKGGNKNFEIKEVPKLNHLFQTCNTCTLQEYGQLTETFSPAALQIIGDWLNKNVK